MIHRREMIRKREEKAKRLHRELEGLPIETQMELLKRYEDGIAE